MIEPYKENIDMTVSWVGNLRIGRGLRAIISGKPASEILKEISISKNVKEAADQVKAKMESKEEYKTYLLNNERVNIIMRDRRNVFVENELTERLKTIEAIATAMQKVFQNCDQLDTISIWKGANDGAKSWLKYKNELLLDDDIDMYIIVAKPGKFQEDHTLDEFTNMCKEFVKIMSTYQNPHILEAEVEGDETGWGLYVRLRPGPDFLNFAKRCGFKYSSAFFDMDKL